MADVMGRVNKERAELAEQYTKEVMEQSADVLDVLRMLDVSKIFDFEALKAVLESELRGKILMAIYGYTVWLATNLVRYAAMNPQQISDMQELPVCSDTNLNILADEYGVKRSILERTITRMTKLGTDLPLVGRIDEDGNLVPDKDTLEQWAKLYDWS